jgi:hypothetical protein
MIKRRGRRKAAAPRAAVLVRLPPELLDAVDRYRSLWSRTQFIHRAVDRAVRAERVSRLNSRAAAVRRATAGA